MAAISLRSLTMVLKNADMPRLLEFIGIPQLKRGPNTQSVNSVTKYGHISYLETCKGKRFPSTSDTILYTFMNESWTMTESATY